MLSPRSFKQQQGVAIVVALFIMALVASMAYIMMARLSRDTQRTTLILRDTQAAFYAQGSVAWAIEQLRRDWENQKPDQLIDKLPMTSPTNTINDYHISSTIEDMQARFNLNNLNDTEAQTSFKRLIQSVAPNLSEEKIQAIVNAVVHWITLGSMVSVSELRSVKGITPAIYHALQPYVTALPEAAALVNVQSAPAPILAVLSPTMNLEAGNAIMALRSTSPFVSMQQFLNNDIVKNHPISAQKVTVVSSYFLVVTNVTIEKQQLVLYTLLERATKGDQLAINILWQSKGIG
ncbi:MAG: general secretion pathway protein GspK [Gammaproteobacteria bacterium]|nr:MAG: general secretion pathway protein GspK [Gammaproteobacteria bacterium]